MFTLDYRSRKPLYDQLCQSIERMAACGVLEPGSRQALRAGIQAALDAGMTPAEIRQEGEAYLQERGTKCL